MLNKELCFHFALGASGGVASPDQSKIAKTLFYTFPLVHWSQLIPAPRPEEIF
jgi:hypothetical protein